MIYNPPPPPLVAGALIKGGMGLHLQTANAKLRRSCACMPGGREARRVFVGQVSGYLLFDMAG